MTVNNLRDAMGQINEEYITEAIEYRRTSEEVPDVPEDNDKIKSENRNHSVFYVISAVAACTALVLTVNHFTNPKNIGTPETDNSVIIETTAVTSTETSVKDENYYTDCDVTTADYIFTSVQSSAETTGVLTSETNTGTLVTEYTRINNVVTHQDLPSQTSSGSVITEHISNPVVTAQGTGTSVPEETTTRTDISDIVTTGSVSTLTPEDAPPAVESPFPEEPPHAEPPVHEVTTVTSELPVLVEPKQQSVIYDNYNTLANVFIKNLNDIITDLKNEYVNVNTLSLEKFRDMTVENNSVIIPVYDGKELPLRDKKGYSNITFYTRELYSKPCFFFHFADGTTNSYVKIYDISDELKTTGVNNAYDFMKIMDPDPNDNKSYPSYDSINPETVNMSDRNVEVVFGTLDNDPRVYANFIYNNSLVIICCSQEKIDSGFLNLFSLGEMPLAN